MSDATDLDETRRLCYIAKVAVLAGKDISTDLAGTLVHAMAHHSNMVNTEWAVRFGAQLVTSPEYRDYQFCLDAIDTIIAKCES